MKILKILFVIILLPIFAGAKNIELPKDVVDLLQKKYPKSQMLFSTECKLGEVKFETIGILVQKIQPAKSEIGKNPLTAVVAIQENKKWNLTELSTQLEYSKGSDSDFLSEFWNDGKFIELFEIKCTLPNADKDINLKSNGEWTKNFKSEAKLKAKSKESHLCFQASATYNSWACFGIAQKTSVLESSFVQMNAD